jgi:hypothetical protein
VAFVTDYIFWFLDAMEDVKLLSLAFVTDYIFWFLDAMEDVKLLSLNLQIDSPIQIIILFQLGIFTG